MPVTWLLSKPIPCLWTVLLTIWLPRRRDTFWFPSYLNRLRQGHPNPDQAGDGPDGRVLASDLQEVELVEESAQDRQDCCLLALAWEAEELTADLRVFPVDRVPAASGVLACHLCRPVDQVEMQALDPLRESAVVWLRRPVSR